MRVTYLPVLAILRELYLQPRTMERFRTYISTMTGDGDDIALPITVANPMAKEHAVAALDRLLAAGAEEAGEAAAAEADRRLSRIEGPKNILIKASVVLSDDVGGGWTNRHTTEASVRFPGRGALKRPFAVAQVWTSESPTSEQVRQEVLAAIYRVAWQQRHGLPTRLCDMLAQEGLAAAFAGIQPHLDEPALSEAAGKIDKLGDDPPYPTTFAAMYGDAAAIELGYQPLGLPARAGFEVAIARAQTEDALAAL